jgi:hypothetical protein
MPATIAVERALLLLCQAAKIEHGAWDHRQSQRATQLEESKGQPLQ